MHTSHTHTHTHTSHTLTRTHHRLTLSQVSISQNVSENRATWLHELALLAYSSLQVANTVTLSVYHCLLQLQATTHNCTREASIPLPANQPRMTAPAPSCHPLPVNHHKMIATTIEVFFFFIELWNWIVCDWNGYGIELCILNSVCVDYNPQNLLRL